jgi:hypothetical protein
MRMDLSGVTGVDLGVGGSWMGSGSGLTPGVWLGFEDAFGGEYFARWGGAGDV